MFVDLPPDVADAKPVIVLAQSQRTQQTAKVHQRAIGTCRIMENNPEGEFGGGIPVSLSGEAVNYLFEFENRRVDESGAKVTLLQAPKHGRLGNEWKGALTYTPKAGFYGRDKIVARVEIDGYQVTVAYFINVVQHGTQESEESIRRYCGSKGIRWKISLSDSSLDSASLLPLLNFAGITGIANVEIADLSGSSVGSTTKNTVTVDDNAAGHGWYIDYTPYLNEEYLPTANPNEWIAKADSEAAGKLDMLSVLLHEYGHVLGIEHSASAHDYMATTLAPGVRRLPSADELALMAKLAGDLRLELAGENAPSPDAPSSPLPTAPLGGSLGLALLDRLRGNRFGGWNVAVDSASLIPQYAVAANPKLSNTEFAGGQGWSTTGDVRFQGGAATLSETAASQTRLNQVFIVGENDRFLSFTVADTALDDADQAPDDAFEVALLDANSGASLLGGTGLTRNDAFLNLQADGTERKSQAVTSIRNADGSRTYLVDLAGIPAGTAVNLAHKACA